MCVSFLLVSEVPTMEDIKLWLLTYFPVAWAGHICQGLCLSIFGPTQPYLAQNIGVPNDQINFIWTIRAFGSCVATILTGFFFKDFLKHRGQKLLFLSLSVLLAGLFIGLIPWCSSFESLLLSNDDISFYLPFYYLICLAILLSGLFSGSLSTASNSLVLYMLGPARSPPFIQSLHASVAVGFALGQAPQFTSRKSQTFALGSLIVRPFLPAKEESNEVCDEATRIPERTTQVNESKSGYIDASDGKIAFDLEWPFLIISIICLITTIFYLIISTHTNLNFSFFYSNSCGRCSYA